ncbi:MAG: hypothetical protein MK078_01710 [Crocinitomicaceae bacterium]|nr:hypothetical protein [Crocinitomicaceae bacterium]
MRKYYSNIIVKISLAYILFLGVSCNAIFEKNIEEDEMEMILPTDNDTISTNNVHFKWHQLDGASFYNLQIVEPDFVNINTFILDSNITDEEFYFIMDPGSYQFRIRGENSAHQTQYLGPFTIVVDSVSDLSSQAIPLLSPNDNIYSNATTFTFSWQGIYAADSYELQIRSGSDFDASGTIIHSASGIFGTSYSPPADQFSAEDVYTWGVKASNATSESDFSSRRIYIDRTSPIEQTLTAPANAASFTDTVSFYWTTSTDVGTIQSPVTSYLVLANDTNFTSIITTYETTLDTAFHVFSTSGTYWWRMYAQDEAGNISDFFTEQRKIIIP